jgi:uncharacterized membrane protein YoaT (DUF817 family)
MLCLVSYGTRTASADFFIPFYIVDVRVVLDVTGINVFFHGIIINNCDTVESGHFYFPLTHIFAQLTEG